MRRVGGPNGDFFEKKPLPWLWEVLRIIIIRVYFKKFSPFSNPYAMSIYHAPQAPSAHSPHDLAAQLQGLVSELQHTRESVLGQIDSQIARATSLLTHLQVAQPGPTTQTASHPLHHPPKLTSIVMTAPVTDGIDPNLEQATLAELNEALSLAFKEIAGRGGMLRPGE
jgi:hypothetical protein